MAQGLLGSEFSLEKLELNHGVCGGTDAEEWSTQVTGQWGGSLWPRARRSPRLPSPYSAAGISVGTVGPRGRLAWTLTPAPPGPVRGG